MPIDNRSAAGTVSYWLRVTIAAGAAIGTIDSVTFTATSSTTATITSAAFDLASNADPVTYEYSLDGAGFAACTDPVTYSSLAEGSHTLQLRAKNAAGTLDPARRRKRA